MKPFIVATLVHYCVKYTVSLMSPYGIYYIRHIVTLHYTCYLCCLFLSVISNQFEWSSRTEIERSRVFLGAINGNCYLLGCYEVIEMCRWYYSHCTSKQVKGFIRRAVLRDMSTLF